MIIGVFIYLVGCVLSFLMYRRDYLRDTGTWTVGERCFGLLYGGFSWVGVAALLFENASRSDKPAKW